MRSRWQPPRSWPEPARRSSPRHPRRPSPDDAASGNGEIEELLGSRVLADGVLIGTVTAVLVDAGSGAGLVAEISGAWSDDVSFLPLPAARLEVEGLEASALAILTARDMPFYARRGVLRVGSDGVSRFERDTLEATR